MGSSNKLRANALSTKVTTTTHGKKATFTLITRNVGAGHYVPTGLPARRLLVRVSAVNDSGAGQVLAEKSFGRKLVDGAGNPAPFFAAERVVEDTRVAPGKSTTARLTVELAAHGALRIELLWRPIAKEIAGRVGIEITGDEVLHSQLFRVQASGKLVRSREKTQ